ncbi:MAG TPA: FMN-binding protein [bacterium]|nr:FMN-binding protein [bacterium]
MTRRWPWIVTLAVLLTVTASSAEEPPTEEEIGAVEVLASEAEALTAIFPDADSAQPGLLRVEPAVAADLHARLGGEIRDTAFVFYRVFEAGQSVGWAVVGEEKGKYRPITYMAGIDTTLRIVDVRVLIYRESRGGEIRHTRFLKQYRGKSLESPLRINRDIVNITGATISVNALNVGVRKALAVAAILQEGSPTP